MLSPKGHTVVSINTKRTYMRSFRNCCESTIPSQLHEAAKLGCLAVKKNSTLAVQCPASAGFAKLRSSPVTTPPSAYFPCAELLTVLLGLQRFEATHNPLVHGSNPCDPTVFKAAHCVAFSFTASRKVSVRFDTTPHSPAGRTLRL